MPRYPAASAAEASRSPSAPRFQLITFLVRGPARRRRRGHARSTTFHPLTVTMQLFVAGRRRCHGSRVQITFRGRCARIPLHARDHTYGMTRGYHCEDDFIISSEGQAVSPVMNLITSRFLLSSLSLPRRRGVFPRLGGYLLFVCRVAFSLKRVRESLRNFKS